MKKLYFFVIFCFLMSFSACNFSVTRSAFYHKDIATIHYRTLNAYSGFEAIRLYDFENLSYYESAKDLLGFMMEDAFIALDTNKVDTVKKGIVASGLYNLKEGYMPNRFVSDSNHWILTITFSDGATFLSQGYHEYPMQKTAIDNAFYDSFGLYLFRNTTLSSDRSDVYLVETLTFAEDGEEYGVAQLNKAFIGNVEATHLFGINSDTDYLLIDNYYDYIRLWSMMSGTQIEDIDPDVINPMYEDYYWLYIKRVITASHESRVIYNLRDFKLNEMTLRINYLLDEGNDVAVVCFDLVWLPADKLEGITNQFRLSIRDRW